MQLLHIMQNVGVLLIMKSSILIKLKAKGSLHIVTKQGEKKSLKVAELELENHDHEIIQGFDNEQKRES